MSLRRVRLFVAACVLGGPLLRAQAWTPPKDTATIGFGYQYVFIKQHVLAHGETVERGHIRAQDVQIQLGYSPTDRLALSFGLPYVVARYHGPIPHQLPIDDGTYHGTWQDYRIDARYQLSRGPIAFTPALAAVIPSHHYTYFAHSAVGRDLREVTAAFYSGMTFDVATPFRSCGCPTSTYVQSRFAYSFVEHVLGRRVDHADGDVDFGYFATEKLGIRALVSYRTTIGGIDWNYHWPDYSSPLFLHHDQLLASRHLNVGAGANYSVSDRLDVYTSLLRTLSGRNDHKIHLATNVGVGWTFGPRAAIAALAKRAAATSAP